MPPKKQLPAPIDRPLSRAYLREFTGWSPEYPPGISDPTSLRIMENTQIQRDGSLRVRPGLRYLSLRQVSPPAPLVEEAIGSHEPFFLNNGSKAYLFAVREAGGEVGFRVLANTGLGLVVQTLTASDIGFALPQGYAALCFPEATSYVKYLQIDNKIFALSNAGAPMRQFDVGTTKTARVLTAVTRPEWNTGDKLTVVQPDTAWVASGVPTGERENFVLNPSFEASTYAWAAGSSLCLLTRSTAQAMSGGLASGRLESLPVRINLMPASLGAPATVQGDWGPGSNLTAGDPVLVGGWLTATIPRYTSPPLKYYINSPASAVVAGQQYRIAFDWTRANSKLHISLMYRWFASNGAQIGSDNEAPAIAMAEAVGPTSGRAQITTGSAPAGATSLVIYPYTMPTSTTSTLFRLRNVVVELGPGAALPFFDGDSGADYFWSGTAKNSPALYHPAVPVSANYAPPISVAAGTAYTSSVSLKAGTTARTFTLYMRWYSSGFGSLLGTDTASSADVNTAFSRLHKTATAPAGATILLVSLATSVGVARNEYHYIDQLLVEASATLKAYFDGSLNDTSLLVYDWRGTPNESISRELEYSAPTSVPAAVTPTADTLISSDAAKNVYSTGFFYTFSNEIGESAASQVTVVKMQRGWSQWKWELGTAGAPNGTATLDPGLCADQLVAYMPGTTFQEAMDQGATKWSLYMLTWSNQDPAPVQAVRLSVRDLPLGAVHGSRGWQRMTPQQADANAEVVGLPSEVNRYNYSQPSRGGQGIVAADRMVMVFDPVDAAVIRWSSGEMGNYTDFSAHRGGGYKTLTSGNLYVPACVKLWQNPQSADTLTILCMGTDGYSTGYYMAPAQIASQSEATNIMGFEETTATPGTVSPFGCEVMNNALYHPLDEQIMKSTATNYNINHSSITDAVQSVYRGLKDKHQIVSSLHDTRLYYLVNNPRGAALEPGCWGNEVWVFDGQAKAGSWSRWLVQGQSLRKFEQGDEIVMSVVRPDGIFYFDDSYTVDDYVVGSTIAQRNIAWQVETNTQGANRAHDAWAHVQQLGIVLGNFQGHLRYGVRGYDFNGKRINISKVVTDTNSPGTDGMPFDLEDFLQIRRDMKEWFFYASSATDEEGALLHSEGQINLVQYRYTPSTVNTGYEFGSVETFEYGLGSPGPNSVNGIPIPYIDTGRP